MGVFSISYESPKSILSLATIDFLGTLLFKRGRKSRERDMKRKEERRKKGRRTEEANGRNWIPLMAVLDKFWLSQSLQTMESE